MIINSIGVDSDLLEAFICDSIREGKIEDSRIPIKYEILKRNGFSFTGGGDYCLENGFDLYASLRNGWMVVGTTYIEDISGIEYIDELEILYFKLYGKHLNIV